MSQVQNESQDEQPLNPVVRVLNPLWQDAVTRLQSEEAYKKLVKGYAGANPINLFAITADQERDFCRTLVKGAFRVIGLNHREYKDCYTACIDKCVRTHVVRATTWLDWDGHRDFCVRLKQAVELTNDTKKQHILDAPSTIAAIVVKQLRNVDTIGNDNITAALMRYRFFQFAHRSVQLYAQTKAPIILTNLPFKETAMSLEAPSSAEARHHIELNDVSTMMEIQVTDEDPTRNMAQLMLECQQFDLQGSKPRTPSPPPKMQLLRNKIITRVRVP